MNTTDLAQKMVSIKKVVDEQAEDEGLWFDAETTPEAYLQQALRRLHAQIERCITIKRRGTWELF